MRSRKNKPLETAAEVRLAAMDLLARREHSRRELSQKLGRRVNDQALLAAALDQLETDKLLSDARFCEAFVRMRFNSGYGPVRIRAELQERGVSTELIGHYLALDESDWTAQAREAFDKKFGENPETDAKSRARQQRFLAQRGFSFEQIRRALSQLDKE